MPEKRKFKRRHLIYYLRVFEKNGDTLRIRCGYITWGHNDNERIAY